MIFWICLIVSIIFTIVVCTIDIDDYFGIFITSTAVAIVGWISSFIMLIGILEANLCVDGLIASNQERYNSLKYQAENNLYENDIDFGKKELVNQIQAWNEDVAKGKVLQKNFWVGIFYPNIFDQFETIPIDSLFAKDETTVEFPNESADDRLEDLIDESDAPSPSESYIEPESQSMEESIGEQIEETIDEVLYSPATFRVLGVLRWNGWRWTWYSERVLPGKGLKIPGRHNDDNGYICDKDEYICLASSTLSKGTIIDTPLGKQGKVYDTGCPEDTIDVYVGW